MSDIAAALGRLARSPAMKLAVIGLLVLVLLIPLLMAGGLVSERHSRARGVRAEVARIWGQPQRLNGPFLVVPYTVRTETREGEKVIEQTHERRAIFTPEQLGFKADTASKVLHRGIYTVNVYTAKTGIDGRFAAPDMSEVASKPLSVRWNEAMLVLGLSDVSGIKEAANLRIEGGAELPFAPSIGIPGVNTTGVHVRLGTDGGPFAGPDAKPHAFAFHIDLVFTGSGELSFTPAARETRVALASDWPSPSFSGTFLPSDRNVADSGFTAAWRVPHLARSVPGAWTLSEQGLERLNAYAFGVSYYQPVDFYDLVNRSVKYGLMFLASAFTAVFMLELLSGARIHAVQYLLVGFALVFFFVLLLSLAEHMGFGPAYLVASAATGGMLSLYVTKALGSVRKGLVMAGVFALLYGLLYLILRLEDYALLAGALLGFAALTVVMFVTLKVDWSGRRGAGLPQPGEPGSPGATGA